MTESYMNRSPMDRKKKFKYDGLFRKNDFMDLAEAMIEEGQAGKRTWREIEKAFEKAKKESRDRRHGL